MQKKSLIKKFFIHLIELYQRMPIGTHRQCKYIPSCSEYTKEAIEYYGVIRGVFKGFIRILKCNPFSKGGLDPVKK